MDEEKLDVYLDFSKAFSRDILIDKLMKYGLNGLTLRWAETWLKSRPREGCDQQRRAQLESSHW